jgi:hypothetical protein
MNRAEIESMLVEIDSTELLDASAYNCYWVQKQGTADIFYVDAGVRRYVNNNTFNGMVNRHVSLLRLPDIEFLPLGDPFPDGTALIRPGNSPDVYLYEAGEPGIKRYVGLTVFRQSQFDMRHVQSWPIAVFNLVPTGDPLRERA